ncbi:MAG TPA: hypothetical protein VNN17_07155 [Terriglobia bacterium]|nr:hypothetical protein [Terriglobia bacterium]
MRLLLQLLLLLAGLWLLRILWKAIRGAGEPQRTSGTAGGRRLAGELKQDPHCGTYVSPEISYKSSQGGAELHFCSAQCRGEYHRSRNAAR